MSPERELVEKFKEAVETLKVEAIFPYLADEVTYELLPSTVGRKLTRAGWIEQMTTMATVTQSINFDVTNIIEFPLFLVAQIDVVLTFPFGPVAYEVILLFHFIKDASGSLKISNVVEYVDSFKMKEFMAKLGSGLPPPS